MNKRQKTVLCCGMAVFLLAGMFLVPYEDYWKGEIHDTAFGSLFSRPRWGGNRPYNVNMSLYLMQQGMIAALCVGAVFLAGDTKEPKGGA